MIREAITRAALSSAIVLAGCVAKSPAITDPVEGVPLAQQRVLDRNELDYKWPFEMGSGTIACDGGALFFRSGGTTYALTRSAGTRGYANIDAIRRTQASGPPADPVSRLTQEERMKIFAQSAACREKPATAADCKTRLLSRHGLSESELTRVDAEGAERYWPPLKAPLMSLDAVVDVARQLCPQ